MPNKNKKKIASLKTDIIAGIASKSITPTNPPVILYDETAKALVDGVNTGYGAIVTTTFGTVDEKILQELSENVYFFSAAKTFQQTLEMSQAFQQYEDKLISFKEFSDQAGQIFDDYNTAYLESEYYTAINKATTAAKWQTVEKEKDVMQYIKIICVEDELLCDICAEFDGMTFPVDDPASDDCIPPFHYNNCRCTFETLDEDEGKAQAWQDDEIGEATDNADNAGRIELFKTNPGKDREIFKTTGEGKHPYFDVPKEYQDFAKENFGFSVPKNK